MFDDYSNPDLLSINQMLTPSDRSPDIILLAVHGTLSVSSTTTTTTTTTTTLPYLLIGTDQPSINRRPQHLRLFTGMSFIRHRLPVPGKRLLRETIFPSGTRHRTTNDPFISPSTSATHQIRTNITHVANLVTEDRCSSMPWSYHHHGLVAGRIPLMQVAMQAIWRLKSVVVVAFMLGMGRAYAVCAGPEPVAFFEVGGERR
jgi:hypothetical protein